MAVEDLEDVQEAVEAFETMERAINDRKFSQAEAVDLWKDVKGRADSWIRTISEEMEAE